MVFLPRKKYNKDAPILMDCNKGSGDSIHHICGLQRERKKCQKCIL